MNERSKNGTSDPILSGMPLADMIRDPKRTLERLVGTKALQQATAGITVGPPASRSEWPNFTSIHYVFGFASSPQSTLFL